MLCYLAFSFAFLFISDIVRKSGVDQSLQCCYTVQSMPLMTCSGDDHCWLVSDCQLSSDRFIFHRFLSSPLFERFLCFFFSDESSSHIWMLRCSIGPKSNDFNLVPMLINRGEMFLTYYCLHMFYFQTSFKDHSIRSFFPLIFLLVGAFRNETTPEI